MAEKLLETSTLNAAKIITLLPADRAAEVIKAMKEKTREAVEGKPPPQPSSPKKGRKSEGDRS